MGARDDAQERDAAVRNRLLAEECERLRAERDGLRLELAKVKNVMSNPRAKVLRRCTRCGHSTRKLTCDYCGGLPVDMGVSA